MNEEAAAGAPSYQLYSTTAVVVATAIGSLIAGGIVLAIDLHRLGRQGQAWLWIVLTAIGTALVLAVGMRLPDEVPGAVVWLPALLVMGGVARSILTRPLAVHAETGGKLASTWGAAGIGALCLIALLAVIFGYVWFTPPFPGDVVEVQGNEVYHSGGATRAEARRLGEYLLEEEFFEPDGGMTVHLEKTDGGHAIDLLVVDGAWDDADVLAWVTELRTALLERGFGPRLDLRLCDDTPRVRRTITVP